MSINTWIVIGHPTVWDCVTEIQSDEDYIAMDHDELLETAEAHAEGALEALEERDLEMVMTHVGYLYGCRDLVYKKSYVKRHGWWNIPLGQQLREMSERVTEKVYKFFRKKAGKYKAWYDEYGGSPGKR